MVDANNAESKHESPRKAQSQNAASGHAQGKGWRAVKELLIRLWAAGILVAVIAIAYLSIAYLVDHVFSPQEVPPRILEWQSKLDPQMLRAETAPGVEAETPRAPLGHYHGVDAWYEPATYVSCTLSGCHSPLPHQERKEIRAFANLHATFMTCQMCHEKGMSSGVETVWVDPATGTALGEPPAMLQLIDFLASVDEPEDRAAFTAKVVGLLDLALIQSGEHPLLEHLGLRLRTTQPGSPVWTQSLTDLRRELPQHARGEYGARLAPAVGGRDQAEFHREIGALADRYFSRESDTDRENLTRQIHAQVNPAPAGCLACHGGEPARVDFVKAGYTSERAKALRHVEIARLMDRLLKGQPFHLPSIVLPGASSSGDTQE